MLAETAAQAQPPLLEVRGLKKHFPVRGGWLERRPAPLKALDGISLTLDRGETLGIVGESGCGKTTLMALFLTALALNLLGDALNEALNPKQ